MLANFVETRILKCLAGVVAVLTCLVCFVCCSSGLPAWVAGVLRSNWISGCTADDCSLECVGCNRRIWAYGPSRLWEWESSCAECRICLSLFSERASSVRVEPNSTPHENET